MPSDTPNAHLETKHLLHPKESITVVFSHKDIPLREELSGLSSLSSEERTIVENEAVNVEEQLLRHYQPGFGIFPSSGKDENYFNQVWTRDMSYATGNFFAEANPATVIDSLQTIFRHQKKNGMLPLRVEKEYLLLKLIPGLWRLAKPLFDLLRNGTERPVYEGQDFSGAEDTVPTAVIAAGELFHASEQGKEFAREHFDQMKRAMDFFRTKTDPKDGLAIATHLNPDWADSLKRKGKLGNINVLWAESLRLMQRMANALGKTEDAALYDAEYARVKESVLQKLYDTDGAYFRAKEGEDRLDTVATVFGALTLLSPEEAVRIEGTLDRRVRRTTGLLNFDPPYPPSQIFEIHRLVGHSGYHNAFVWPWVTAENIKVKTKIAEEHPNTETRERFQAEAADDLLGLAKLFKQIGSAPEIVQPTTEISARTPFYTPPKNFLGSLAAFAGAYRRLKNLKSNRPIG